MGYKRTKPTVYAVFWPELNVFKVGITASRRWRAFLCRGAIALGLMDDFVDYSEASDFELACHMAMWRVCRRGFRSAKEAAPYLGNAGGGWGECHLVPGDLMPHEILPFIDTQLAVLHAQA